MKLLKFFLNWRIIAPVIFFLGVAIIFLIQDNAPEYDTGTKYQGILLNPEKEIKSHAMINHDGKDVTFPSASGKYQLIFFGYTSCPDICPTTLHKIKQVIRSVRENDNIDYFFISIDTERDKPEILKHFVSFFHPKIKGITGTLHNIKGVEREFGILTRKFQGKTALAYQLEHSVFMYLLNEQGKLMLMYPGSTSSKQMISDLNLLIKNKKT